MILGLLTTRARKNHTSTGPVARTRWRIYITSGNGNVNVSIEEAFFRLTSGGANLAAGGTPSADSFYNSSYGPQYAFDNNTSRRWAALGTNPFPHWLAIQLTAASIINFVTIRIGADTGQDGSDAPKDFKIQSSTDGIAWTDEWSVSGQTGWTPGSSRTFARP
jgi:hypothetical protein